MPSINTRARPEPTTVLLDPALGIAGKRCLFDLQHHHIFGPQLLVGRRIAGRLAAPQPQVAIGLRVVAPAGVILAVDEEVADLLRGRALGLRRIAFEQKAEIGLRQIGDAKRLGGALQLGAAGIEIMRRVAVVVTREIAASSPFSAHRG